ncbi:MAG: HAMP domain-containing protein [Pseudonocardiaceae bacterium]|nr:HAMP domain-containing protein [Pseudonocardiaceae bacterium]
MFSSRRASHRPMPLRTKLIALLVALLAVMCLIIGGITAFALHRFLVRQLDSQVLDAAERAARFSPPPQGERPPGVRDLPPPDPLKAPGQAAGTVNARIVDGRLVFAARLTDTGERQQLNAEQRNTISELPVDSNPYTRYLGDFGDYRLIARTTERGDVVVTGLSLASADETVFTIGLILGGVALAGLLAAGVTGALVVRRTLRPLDRVAATASQVVELPLDRGEVALSERVPELDANHSTEVGQVGHALNRMLGHVGNALEARHASETRVRQFVADASHELRTPLAAIRRYAELTRRGRDAMPDDIAYAMGRVESEAGRMTTLVEDLLLLARLDSGRPLESADVDLSRLVVDAVNDAHIAAGEHHWQLELPPEPVTVPGDAERLHQVLANLLANASAHTPRGTTVTTALSASADGSVVLTVTDDGPGIPGDVLPNIFERFARADSSRSRTGGSTGLGLAIVSAVVAAHNGSVEVSSRPGRTEFAVRLPGAEPEFS